MESSPWEVFDFLKPYIPRRARKPVGLLLGVAVVVSYLATAIKAIAHLIAVTKPYLSPLFWSALTNAILSPAVALLAWSLWRSKRIEPKTENPSLPPHSRWEKFIIHHGVKWRFVIDASVIGAMGEVQGPLCEKCNTQLTRIEPREAFAKYGVAPRGR